MQQQGYAFDAVRGRGYAANSTWQIPAVLAHNLWTSFQLAADARPRRPSLKRTSLYALKSIHTLHYELIARAGPMRRPAGRATFTLAHNLPTRSPFERLAHPLPPASVIDALGLATIGDAGERTGSMKHTGPANAFAEKIMIREGTGHGSSLRLETRLSVWVTFGTWL